MTENILNCGTKNEKQKSSNARPDPLEIITEGCWLAVRFGMRVSPVPTGNLRIESGTYSFGSVSPGSRYHPLEAALVSATKSGDWRADVATDLGVDQEWIQGFLDGFAQKRETSTGGEYFQGYLTAELLRTTRFRHDLPDR